MLEWLASLSKTGILKQHDYLLFNKARLSAGCYRSDAPLHPA
ncbi:hypothetical protein ACZ87_01539 [Candidatus Erwinia dacicola]|uniref:Uncharacterized protein n=1 Tax=Candidatus Erwinia dacicola TaxID=252393 RepID=A0A328TV53_9GAMM|nr:hypothetical protein ACZ87_01539 [Candidatus Erwinia dacicola]